MYAVIDIETTGLYARGHDRVCEIAVVQVDTGGQITDDWHSLVNPRRDLGPQHIHGISAAEVRGAPTFAQVAGRVAQLLKGRVVAAHNLAFDAQFLVAEYNRLGVAVPITHEAGVCTMTMAANFLAVAGDPPPWQYLVSAAAKQTWPYLPITDVAPVLRGQSRGRGDHFLARLVDQLPRVPDPPQADAYLELLDRILLDRYISTAEADALVDMATSLELSRGQAIDLHHGYLRDLASRALEDGVVTDEERQDLYSVASLLGLAPTDADRALTGSARSRPDQGQQRVPGFCLSRGDVVVFTGQMAEPRDVWEKRAAAAGLSVGRSVTKKTRLLVAEDPDTLSGKASKAQAYRIPIVRPDAFLRMIRSGSGLA